MTDRIVLTTVFALSFLTYLAPDLTLTLQLAPLVLLGIWIYCKIIFSSSLLKVLTSAVSAEGLLITVFLPILILGPSIGSDVPDSLQYALLLSVCVVMLRLYTTVVSLREVLEAFFWSGVFSTLVLAVVTFTSLVESMSTLVRFSPLSFHPNLLGFTLAGYFCAMAWKILTGRSYIRVIAALTGTICLVIIFFASSRGSILGLLVGLGTLVFIVFVKANRIQRKKILRLGVLTVGLVTLLVVYLSGLESVKNVFDTADKVLELTNNYRGIDTGLTGRVDRWAAVGHLLANGTIVLGRGFRSSDYEFQAVDNSYLVILYDLGVVALIVIATRFVFILARFIRSYLRSDEPARSAFWLTCCLVMIVLMVNSTVARYLFGLGNPFSLLALFIFATPLSSAEAGWTKSPIAPKLLRHRIVSA